MVYFKVPKGGLLAIPEHGWPALAAGAILKAKKAGYGLKDAPLQWYLENASQILSLPRSLRSKLNPSLFLLGSAGGHVDGLIGVHVDDDLITGSERFFKDVVEKLKKMFVYGKWHKPCQPRQSVEQCGTDGVSR